MFAANAKAPFAWKHRDVAFKGGDRDRRPGTGERKKKNVAGKPNRTGTGLLLRLFDISGRTTSIPIAPGSRNTRRTLVLLAEAVRTLAILRFKLKAYVCGSACRSYEAAQSVARHPGTRTSRMKKRSQEARIPEDGPRDCKFRGGMRSAIRLLYISSEKPRRKEIKWRFRGFVT